MCWTNLCLDSGSGFLEVISTDRLTNIYSIEIKCCLTGYFLPIPACSVMLSSLRGSLMHTVPEANAMITEHNEHQLMSLTWGEGPDRFTSSAEARQWRYALISHYHLAFTASLRHSIQLLHITAETESSGYIYKKESLSKRKNRNDVGLAHSSLSGPSYLPSCSWAHHISFLMNSPIKRGSSISLSTFLFHCLPLLPAPLEDIRVYRLLCWAAASDLQISFTLRILLDREP